MNQNKLDSFFWGILILAIGILFLLKNMGFQLDIVHAIWKFWPSVLILIGVKNIYLYYSTKK